MIKHLLDEEWKRSDIASKGWSTRKSVHPHVINEMKVSSSMSSKSDDNEPIVSTDSQMNVKTLPESAVKKKPDIFSDFAHGDKALLESLRVRTNAYKNQKAYDRPGKTNAMQQAGKV